MLVFFCFAELNLAWIDRIPNLKDISARIYMENLFHDQGRSVCAPPLENRFVSGDCRGNICARILFAVIRFGLGWFHFHICFCTAGQICAHKACVHFAVHTSPERGALENIIWRAGWCVEHFAQSFDDDIRRLVANVLCIGRVHIAHCRAIREWVFER